MTRTAMAGKAIPVAIAVFALAILITSIELSSTARLVPASIAVFVLVLISVEMLGRRTEHQAPAAAVNGLAQELLWLVALPIAIATVGLTIGVPVFLCCYLRIRAATSWPAALGAAAIGWSVLHLVLHRVLGVTLS